MADTFTVAREEQTPHTRAGRSLEGDEHEADGLVRCAAFRTGDARDGHRDVGARRLARTGGHGARRLLGDRTLRLEPPRADAWQLHLRTVAVSHERALEVGARAGQAGQPRAEHPPGAR